MTQISDLESLVGQLPKPYKAESLKNIKQIFSHLSITDENIEAVHNALQPLKILDLNKFFEERWNALSPSSRQRFVELRITGSGDRDRTISGCSALAADLVVKDLGSSAQLLGAAFSHARTSDAVARTLLDVLRRDWLSGGSPLPFESLTWPGLGASWRLPFLYGLVNAFQMKDPSKRKLAPYVSHALKTWLAELASSPAISPEDASKLGALTRRLDPAPQKASESETTEPAEFEPQPSSSLGVATVPPITSPTLSVNVPFQSQKVSDSKGGLNEQSELPHVVAKGPAPAPAQSTEANAVTHAIENLQEVWRHFASSLTRGPSATPAIAQIRELETKLKDAEGELDTEIVNNQHLKRSLLVATEQAESLREENVTLKEQLVEAREQCGAAENRVRDSQIKVQALQGRADEMEKRLAGQEQAQIGHLQATLKEERRVYRIEIANVLQGKVAQLRSLGEKPAAPELVEAYRAVISGLLSSLESQGVQLER